MTFATVGQLGAVPLKNKQATQIVLDAAKAAGFEITQVWGVGGGDHADGYASDFMVYGNKAAGDWIADYIWNNRVRLGVRWEIWYQRIRSINPQGVYGPPNQWNPMEDRGSTTQNHKDHVHVKWDTAPVGKPAPVKAPVMSYTNGRPNLLVSNLKFGASNIDVAEYNRLLWQKQSDVYKKGLQAKWDAEPAKTFGPMTEQVTKDYYNWLHRTDKANWPEPAPPYPSEPGFELIKHLGGNPR